ncbi:hypothetical protein FNV43_RR19674 [Rhamnella rubrinervis]|uniref:UDP-N-acetylglucosamine--peptide N-acetylglucosaminyltransferase SPINDLY n=1 Tax=Rhamnella rubrinervis TaxID=2594499 RepID=A0A8K0DYA3_9ROSA|nr:hypothetical protein FNV43_RR19674 [Rhamnella rubrinervis]
MKNRNMHIRVGYCSSPFIDVRSFEPFLTKVSEQQEPQPLAKPQLGTMETSIDKSSKVLQEQKIVVLADLNVDPPETDGNDSSSVQLPAPDLTRLVIDESSQDKSTSMSIDNDVVEGEAKRVNKLGKCRSRNSKALVHVTRKMPKNAHAHFVLGLMYQRLGQPSKCLLLESSGDNNVDEELEPEELKEILSKLKESIQLDIRQAAVWNTLGLLLLKTGRLQSAISVLSSLLAVAPTTMIALETLGLLTFKELVLKDQNHPAALINYAAFLLCKYGSIVAGAGANAGDGASKDQVSAINVVKECLLATLKSDPKAAHTWASLANAYYMSGDHRSSSKCLEKAAKLEPNCMSTRYAVAIHRIKDAERSQDPSEQLSWAGNEMASIIRDGDHGLVELPIAWAGVAMVHKAQHEIAAAFETEHNVLQEVKSCCLQFKAAEDPDDAVQWHQLGLHSLCTRQFKNSQKYLKAAVARFKECSYAWSNLGISLQLCEEPAQAEEVYKRALSLATKEHVHAMYSNLGNLYRQQKQYERAKAMFSKSLELQPGYAPAFNNLGLVFVAEGQWEEAKFCFEKALKADPLLDAAKSNMIKTMAISRLYSGLS